MKYEIMLAPQEVLRDVYFLDGKAKMDLIAANFSSYTAHPPINCPYDWEAAAEEAFDLTNNPSRQAEREVKYGRGRSLSIGDIVKVGMNTYYVCDSFGFTVFNIN